MSGFDPTQRYMGDALRLAQRAYEENEVPVGCVIVHERQIIGKAYNQTNLLKDPTAHAEMLAITQAAEHLKHDRLLDCDLYVTIEPCAMCIGALIHARIRTIYFGAPNEKYGACGSVVDLLKDKLWNHEIKLEKGLMRAECAGLLQDFFRTKRKSQLL